jgi:ferric-dicitrate binding protein FerR (iron transport regulator)
MLVAAFVSFGAGALLPVVAHAQVRLVGEGVTPPAPLDLQPGMPFEVAASGEALLVFPHQGFMRCKGGTIGRITPNGILLTRGRVRFNLQKRGSRFVVETPQAVLAVLGTMFDLVVAPGSVKIAMLQGRLEVQPIGGGPREPCIVAAGETMELTGSEVRPGRLRRDDLLDWSAARLPAAPPGSDSGAPPWGFEQLFPTGLVTVGDGSVEWVKGDREIQLAPGDKVAVGARIRAQGETPADLSLGCGSSLRLTPGAHVEVQAYGFVLHEGTVLVRHTGTDFPLRISGPGSVQVERQGVGEIRHAGEFLQVRCHAGRVTLPAGQGPRVLAPGETADVRTSGATIPGTPMPPMSWGQIRASARPAPFPGPEPTGIEPAANVGPSFEPPDTFGEPGSGGAGMDDVLDF